MAKFSKEMLKDLVKECLVEILAEGIGSRHKPVRTRKKKSASRKPMATESQARRRVLENVSFNSNAKTAVDSLTDDPLMSSIFADTARGTLQEQLSAESAYGGPAANVGASPPAGVSSIPDPMNMFGEASQNWATLAFAEKKLK